MADAPAECLHGWTCRPAALRDDAAFLSAAEQQLPVLLPGAEAQNISNCVWSFAKRQHVLGPSVVDAVARRFPEVVQQANSQAIANLLYGLASMGAAPSRQLLDSCTERLVGHPAAGHRSGCCQHPLGARRAGALPLREHRAEAPAGRRSAGAIWLSRLIGALAAR